MYRSEKWMFYTNIDNTTLVQSGNFDYMNYNYHGSLVLESFEW